MSMATTTANTTPRPWFVEHTSTAGLRIVHGPADEETGFRDDVPHGFPSPEGLLRDGPYADPAVARANAELIVRAVNAHDELVSAARSALPHLRHSPSCEATIERALWECSCGMAAAFDALGAAVAKAERR